jgi:hypothetical protein
MLDLVEGAKIVQALAPTTQGAADDGDYVTMKDAHTVWTIINVSAATTDVTFTPKNASAYAGTGAAAVDGGCKFWVNTNTTNLDRMTASTASTAYTLSDNATKALVVCRYDPSNAPSSHPYFAMTCSTAGTAAAGTVAMTYVMESRFGGYQQVIATTSST